jgi:hypothetical protein|tara:strand:+ start:21072 stop:21365 length:294 start_codon:yes stop_codon:yes gene_type:complete
MENMNIDEENPQLKKVVFKNTELKKIIVNFVGNVKDEENVTVEMIVETMAKEFPEFLLAVAEENWIRGYQQALIDSEQDEHFFENAEGAPKNDKIHT